MPSYMVLGRYTQKGIESIKGAPARLEAVKQAARQADVDVKGFYVTPWSVRLRMHYGRKRRRGDGPAHARYVRPR